MNPFRSSAMSQSSTESGALRDLARGFADAMQEQPPTPAPDPSSPPPPSPVVDAPPAPSGVLLNDGTTFRFEDGRLILQDQTGAETSININNADLIPPQVPEIIFLSFAGLIGLIMAFPIGRAIARWIDRRNVAAPASEDVGRRLAAIEQAVDAVAIEVERMSEANRFTTKLLTERVAAPDFAAASRVPEPVRAPAAHDPLSRPPSDRRS